MNLDIETFVKKVKDGLQISETKADILKWLTVLKSLLVKERIQTLDDIKKYDYKMEEMHKLIADCHIKQLYENLLTKFSVEWISIVGSENFNFLVKPVFLQGNDKYSFITLFQASIENNKMDFKCQRCVILLEDFLNRENLTRLLWNQSVCNTNHESEGSHSLALNPEQEILVGFLTSLPIKMGNKLRLENSIAFLPQSFIPILASSIVDTLDLAHQVLIQKENVSLYFISVLIGKLSLVGYANLFLETVLPHLCLRVREDYLFCRICERIFMCVPARCQEAVVVPLLRQIPWYGLVDKFLGDAVVHNTSLKMLLCTKMLLHRVFPKPKTTLHNIIGYLSAFHTRRHLLTEVCLSLLQVWGDASSIRRISAEQHLYISKALLVCIGYLNEKEKLSIQREFLQLLMPGVQAHLESSDPTSRLLGMVMAKSLTKVVLPPGPELEFELDQSNPEVLDLLSYSDPLIDPGIFEAENMVLKSEDKDNFSNINQGPRSIPPQHESVVNTSEANSVLDSDDDLEPFDLTNDRKVEKGKQPKFIRDCMEGLLCSSDEPDRIELCLSAAEALIRKKADGLEEIAVEFCKILLHMQDTHNLDNFQANRFGSLVALTVMCPSQVSEYLTSQFYESNYSIKQRMDMLETLTSAAHELSNVDKGLQSHSFQDSAAPNVSLVGSEALLWRKVIQGRIKDNARKFVHSRRQPEPVVTLNRFAPVAGKFFYPLMYGMGKRNMCLDLIEKDRLLLFQLLNTLAVVLYSCKNTHICTHMGRALLEFSWPIRLHQDSYLRQGVLIATTAVFLVVPTHSLMSDMFSNTIETKVWLEDVIERDPDTTCQKMAAEACFILQNNMNKEIISGP